MGKIDIKKIFGIFWNKKCQIILIILLFSILGAIYTMFFTEINNLHYIFKKIQIFEENNYTKNVSIFAIVGTVVALIYAFIKEMLKTTVKTSKDIEKKLKLPILESIPKYNSK